MNKWECVAEVMRLIPARSRATVAIVGIIGFVGFAGMISIGMGAKATTLLSNLMQ
ncbi:hypothetical protein [Sphingobium yanoikuyae]|jgi:hypothetical protein|uniref:hypothetical protein n=1 Tax=Sphingobium yanoikuyae TaxID=13690 RepID=UPI0035C79193